jgi:hypothetical protein
MASSGCPAKLWGGRLPSLRWPWNWTAHTSPPTGAVVAVEPTAGVPDVVFFNGDLRRLYVAIGEPGVIEVFDTAPLRRHATVATAAGAQTLSFDAGSNIVCAFLPETHPAAVYSDRA